MRRHNCFWPGGKPEVPNLVYVLSITAPTRQTILPWWKAKLLTKSSNWWSLRQRSSLEFGKYTHQLQLLLYRVPLRLHSLIVSKLAGIILSDSTDRNVSLRGLLLQSAR